MTTLTLAGDEAVVQTKVAHRSTWAAGDYGSVARHIDQIPPAHLLASVGISPAHRVLDVATGSGNVAIRAARAGAEVTGVDLVPKLLDTGWARAEEAGVEVAWAAGDAEALPFEDGSFDRVLSVFGVQFAPRHQVVAQELTRVCGPGGAIGLVNWTPDGLIGRMFGSSPATCRPRPGSPLRRPCGAARSTSGGCLRIPAWRSHSSAAPTRSSSPRSIATWPSSRTTTVRW